MTPDQIVTEIQSWSTKTDEAILSPARILTMANWLQVQWARDHDLWFLQLRDSSVITTPGNWSVTLPPRLSRPVSVFYTSPTTGSRVNVQLLFKHEFDELYPLQSSEAGEPLYYFLWGTSGFLGPTPSTAITLTIDGYFRDEDLAVGGAENLFSVWAPDLLVYGTLEELVAWGFEEDTRRGLFQEKAQKALMAVRTEGKRRTTLARRLISQRKG